MSPEAGVERAVRNAERGVSDAGTSPRGPFVPLLLLAAGFLGWMALETTQLVSDRLALSATAAQQPGPLENAYHLRVATDSLVRKLQALADKGNPDAQTVVASLEQHGITINPTGKTAAPP
jgi:hypothetical protein